MASKQVNGLCKAPCRKCDEPVPPNTLNCSHCETERRWNQKQYDLLEECSRNGDIEKWNTYRKANQEEPVLLEAALLKGFCLDGANLGQPDNRDESKEPVHLEFACLDWASVERAFFKDASMRGASCIGASLVDSTFGWADLRDSEFGDADLRGADFTGAKLQNAMVDMAVVDGGTVFDDCEIDEVTNFTGTALDSARIEPKLKGLLEYAIRRRHWLDWYRRHPLKRFPARLFWSVSDYGRSTRRIVLVFFWLAVLFGLLYFIRPDLVQDRHSPREPLLRLLRSFYFSIVTMTTLGFGDIHANPRSYVSHIILAVQVLLGYMLLGALVTRFAIMFQGTDVPHEMAPGGARGRHPTCPKCDRRLDRRLKCPSCGRAY